MSLMKISRRSERPAQIALLVESSRAYGRGVLQGIAAYARVHGPWSMYHQERSMDDPVPAWFQNWHGDGVIARIESRAMEKALLRKGLPVVDVRGKLDLDSIPLIETNDRIVAHLAAEHLLERGFRHFAYCGFEHANYSIRRVKYFPPHLAEKGYPCHVYRPQKAIPALQGRRTIDLQREHELHGILYEQDVADWIRSLPKPVGIMACNDIRGQQVLNACRAIGVAVPEEVAVVGVDNDELVCELSDPPLSSVKPDTHRLGFEAAALLDRMIRGEIPSARSKTFIEPVGLVVRQSTDVIAIADRQVSAALAWIRRHACEGIDVENVLDHVPISRSTLERRFLKLLGRSPRQEITRLRLERAKRLLEETDFPLQEIARASGFRHAEYLCSVFKRRLKLTPGEYRRRQIRRP